MSLEDLSTDQLLAHAKTLEADSALLRSLTGNPKTRETVQRALKVLKPDLVIPEIDAKDSVRAEIDEERKARIKLENEIKERDIRARLEKQRSDIKTKYKLSDADVLEVEKLMVREVDPIPTYEGAAQVFLASKQSAIPTPASYLPPTYTMPEKETWGKGIGNPAMLNKIALNEMAAAWNEITSGKVAGLGPARQ
jgi:hypothetical protein